jgi:hypothetical protein
VARSSAPVELRVSTTPPGSTVFVDGKQRGVAPLTVRVLPGRHEVVAERARYAPARAEVEATSGHVELVHERPPVRLRVLSTPPGMSVWIDGALAGITPLEQSVAGYELHHVQLERDGHVSRRKVYVRPPMAVVRVVLPGRRSVYQARAVGVADDLGERVRP